MQIKPSAADGAFGETIKPGDIRLQEGRFSAVLYHTEEPTGSVLAIAERLAKKHLPGVHFSTDPDDAFDIPFIGFEEEHAPLRRFPVPEPSYFEHAKTGLEASDIIALQKTKRATRVLLFMPPNQVWALGRKFNEFVHELACETDTRVWDSNTRQCFSAKSWKEKRLDSWPEGQMPDVSSQIAVRYYRISETSACHRMITLGMDKFALPDIVIERLTASNARGLGGLVNLVCQSIAEKPVIQNGSKQRFDIDALCSEPMRAKRKATFYKGATGRADLRLLRAKPKQGDPANELIEISFENGRGRNEDERRQNIISILWGGKDSISAAHRTPEILEASRKARARLKELRKLFLAGLPSGSRLLVITPFKDSGRETEWMWGEVTGWETQQEIKIILQNLPYLVRGNPAGSSLTVLEADVFDYMLYHPDGTFEGNETGKLMDKLSPTGD